QDMEARNPWSGTVALGAGKVLRAGRAFQTRLLLTEGSHKGKIVFYGHNSKVKVRAGQHVRAGQPIGQTGDSSGGQGGGPAHTEIGFTDGGFNRSGHWTGPGSKGGKMMHDLLHRMRPDWIGKA